MWAKFSPAEMDCRWALARDLMRRHDLNALLVFGNSGVNRHNQANVFWLTNYLDLHHNYLIAPLDESVAPAAREVSDIPIIEWGGYDPAQTLARRLHNVPFEPIVVEV